MQSYGRTGRWERCFSTRLPTQEAVSISPVVTTVPKPPAAPGAPWQLLGLFVLLATGIAGVAWRYHASQKQAIEHEVRNQLLAIADLKVKEISEWRNQQEDEARVLIADDAANLRVRRFVMGQASPEERAALRQSLERICTLLHYASGTITDARGKLLLSVGTIFGGEEHLRLLALEAMKTGNGFLRDFDFHNSARHAHLGVNLPLRTTPGSPAFGALLLGIDPQDYLYPLIKRWPVPSLSGETLLARREGDSILFLNDLRHTSNAALTLRVPISRLEMPVVQAALGVNGPLTGLDYRGVPVFAAARAVPGTAWILVAKVDAEEVQAPIRRRSALLGATTLSLILAAGACVFLLGRRQLIHFYRARYEAELERQALVGHYDHLSRFANDIIVLTDDTGRIVEANDRAVSTYGYSREELLRLNIIQLRHSSDLESFQREWSSAAERGSLVFETVHCGRDLQPIPVEVSVRSINVEGQIFRQSIIRDITERKAMDEKVRNMIETLRTVIESSPSAIVSLTLDSRVTTWNKAAERLFGWTAEEVLGNLPPMIPPDRLTYADELRSRVMNGEVVACWRGDALCRDGRRLTINISAAPLYAEGGGCCGATLNFIDITEREAAEKALQESESRFRRLVENAPEGILLERDLRVLYVNQATVRMLGAASAADLVGHRLLEWILPDDREGVRERSAQAAHAPVLPAERRFLRANGETVHVEVSATPVEYDGQPASLVFLWDITERKRTEADKARLEEQLRQSQKLESLGRLAGGVAHDFNNHLTVIAGYCEMLLSRLAPGDPTREELEEVRAAGNRAAALTQQLLAFSRKQIAEQRPVDLNEVISEESRMLRRLIGEDVEISTRLEPALGRVMADRGQMHQVLMNLAVNARDAMPSGGRILIETANVRLPEDSPAPLPDAPAGDCVRLSVTDTGTGMTPETVQRIFEPFFTTKGLGIGTGLGLSTVYGIVQQSHGRIHVDTHPGTGTAFHIYLPRLAGAAAPALLPDREPELPRGVETVLMVEDQNEVRRLATSILRAGGYHILEASNGPDALVLSQQYTGPIHLLVTDVVMPGMNGRELATRLTGLRPLVKVLYTSGYTADVLGHEGALDPGVAYLPKPFTAAQLSVKVREVLSQPKPHGTIVIIDDDAAVCSVLEQMLVEAGYQVLAANDARTGLRLVAENHPGLVITDLVMPDQDGIETIRVLHREFPAVKVVAMSGAGDGTYLKAASRLGAATTLCKPIDSARLLAVVQDLLS